MATTQEQNRLRMKLRTYRVECSDCRDAGRDIKCKIVDVEGSQSMMTLTLDCPYHGEFTKRMSLKSLMMK